MAEAELTTPALRVIFARLDEQIRWYESHSVAHKRLYKLLKGMVIMAGALTPICAALHLSAAITGSLGVIAVVFESIQQLNQHHQNWLTYRSTGEALKHEKYLYLACAGPYAVADDAARLPLLAERMEQIIGQENSRWLSAQEHAHAHGQGGKRDGAGSAGAQPALVCRYAAPKEAPALPKGGGSPAAGG